MSRFCHICYLVIFIASVRQSYCQIESVVNGGFEQYSTIPNGTSQLENVIGWFNPMFEPCSPPMDTCSSPDYYHELGSGYASLPSNIFATVNDYSGMAVAGVIAWNPIGAREYICTQLTNDFVVGKQYTVGFRLTNGVAAPSEMGSGWGVRGFGLCFTTEEPIQYTYEHLPRISQFHLDTVWYSETWQEISFEFVADSNYRYLTLGNFFPDSLSEPTMVVNETAAFSTAYYFIDDVSVLRLDTVNSVYEWKDAVRTFSQTAEEIGIGLDARVHNATATLYDMAGRETGRVSGNGSSLSLSVGYLPKGLYVLQLRTDIGTVSRKFVIP